MNKEILTSDENQTLEAGSVFSRESIRKKIIVDQLLFSWKVIWVQGKQPSLKGL